MVRLLNQDISLSDDECHIEICLTKDMDTAVFFTVDVFLFEVPSEGETAIGLPC